MAAGAKNKMPHNDIEKKREYERNYRAKNKEKNLKRVRKWQAENKESRTAWLINYHANHGEKVRESLRKWQAKNKERMSETQKQWRKSNQSKVTKYSANRRATKLNATPVWLTDKQKEKTAKIYAKAAAMEKRTGVKHHVDHIVPLQGENVCGLHVPWNLQVITATQNCSKGNKIK